MKSEFWLECCVRHCACASSLETILFRVGTNLYITHLFLHFYELFIATSLEGKICWNVDIERHFTALNVGHSNCGKEEWWFVARRDLKLANWRILYTLQILRYSMLRLQFANITSCRGWGTLSRHRDINREPGLKRLVFAKRHYQRFELDFRRRATWFSREWCSDRRRREERKRREEKKRQPSEGKLSALRS